MKLIKNLLLTLVLVVSLSVTIINPVETFATTYMEKGDFFKHEGLTCKLANKGIRWDHNDNNVAWSNAFVTLKFKNNSEYSIEFNCSVITFTAQDDAGNEYDLGFGIPIKGKDINVIDPGKKLTKKVISYCELPKDYTGQLHIMVDIGGGIRQTMIDID